MIAEAAPNSVPVQMLVATGQLAFTWYLAHIILGLGTIEALGLTGTQPPMIALLAALILFTAAALISWGWKVGAPRAARMVDARRLRLTNAEILCAIFAPLALSMEDSRREIAAPTNFALILSSLKE